MTEAEWLESISVPAMLGFLRGQVGDDKLRHFIRASAAWAWPDLAAQWDGNSTTLFPPRPGQLSTPKLADVAESVNLFAQLLRAGGQFGVMEQRGDVSGWAAARRAQADLLREIVGNPFRPAVVDPHWLRWSDGAVARMARAIHDERAFDRLPILADALEEAGCTDRDILDHCRGPNEHVPGCWVLGLLLLDR